MRVTGGDLGGRVLRVPAGLSTRPTSDKVRQALFNILGPPAAGARVLDLYAGSGALGIEALSRGAAAVVFVEQDERAARALQGNLQALSLLPGAAVEIVRSPVERALPRLRGPFRWVFADPPYAAGLLPDLLRALGGPRRALLHEEAVVVVEHAHHKGAEEPLGDYGLLRLQDRRCYGQTALSFYAPEGPQDPPGTTPP